MPTRTILLIICLLAVLPAAAGAQASNSFAKRQALFQQLEDSQLVRLAGPGLGRREGRLLAHSDAELVLASEPQPLRLPATSVDTVWTRGGSTLVGAIVGAVIGGGLGVLAGTEFGEENAGSAKNVLGMGAMGLLGGSLLGAAFGTPITRWHRRLP